MSGPRPGTAISASRSVGRASATAARVASWKITWAGTPDARASVLRQATSSASTRGSADGADHRPVAAGGRPGLGQPGPFGGHRRLPVAVAVGPEGGQRRFDRRQVGAGLAGHLPPAERAPLRPAEVQLPLRPGQGDVEEAALLGQGGRRLGVGDRDEAPLQAGDEHDRPLQALGLVEGEQLHGVVDPVSGSSSASTVTR